MSFQRCPICDGAGWLVTGTGQMTCGTCAGKKIINCQTGEPPGSYQVTVKVPDIDLSELVKDARSNKGSSAGNNG